MKKLMLAAVLVMVVAAAMPALAQNVEPAPGLEPADEDELICLLPEGCDPGTGIDPVYRDIEPAPGYGHVEPAPGNEPITCDAPDVCREPVEGDIEPFPGHVEPADGDIEPDDCSEALEGSSIYRRPEPATYFDGASLIIPAEEPGCFAIPVPAPADSGPADDTSYEFRPVR